MVRLTFTYAVKSEAGEELALFLPSDPFLEERKQEILARLSSAPGLAPRDANWIFPEDYLPTNKEEEDVSSFRLRDWHLVAMTFTDHVLTFLLARKGDPRFFLIVDEASLDILKEIHADLLIDDGQDVFSAREALEWMGEASREELPRFEPNRKERPISLEEKEEGIEEEFLDAEALQEISKPAFLFNAKPKSLGDHRLAEGESNEEEDIPEEVDLSRFKSGFDGCAKGKPPRISERSPRHEKKEAPTPSPVDWRAMKGAFAPSSSSSPRLIEREEEKRETPEPPSYVKPALDKGKFESSAKPGKIAVPRLMEGTASDRYEFRNPYGLCDLSIDNGKDGHFAILEANVNRALSRCAYLRFAMQTRCVPDRFSRDEEVVRALERFHPEEWKMVACYADGDTPVSGLFLWRNNPRIAIVLGFPRFGFARLFALSSSPIAFEERAGDSWGLAYLASLSPEEATEEASQGDPLPEGTPLEIPLEESDSLEEDTAPETISRKGQRKVYLSGSFLRSAKKAHEAYRSIFDQDCEKTVRELVFASEEELSAFFRQSGGKTIRSSSSRPFTVLDFGTSSQYAASRLFLLPGSELKERRIERDAYVLLYLSNNAEHDAQEKVVERLDRRLSALGPQKIRLHEVLFKEEGSSPQSLAYPSLEQKNLLEGALASLPHLFLGSAGTGKTILSFASALEGAKEGDRILYLTYQKELRDYCSEILEAKGMEQVEVCTFQDLCYRLNVPETSNMRGKRRYREWFFSSVLKNPSLKKAVSSLGGDFEEQCSACYVFYRGVIGGSILLSSSLKGILPEKKFLEMMRKEEGYSDAQKRVIYEIAERYEAHLDKHGGTTDNRLARAILAGGEKYRVYDMVIVDEFQDLSELQFKAVCSLLKKEYPLRLLIYGDDNQAINPTLFDSKDARQIVKGFFDGHAELHCSELSDSYRSGTNLVRYINLVKKVIQGAIGKRGGWIDEAEERSCREDQEDIFVTLLEGAERLPGLLSIVKNSSKDAAILFPSAEARDACRAKFASSLGRAFVDSSFLSVSDAKGREWDTVVLVDFFSSSKGAFEAMLGCDKAGRKSTLHRMMFNRYYVALTRAKNRIVVYESNAGPLVKERLLSGLESAKGSQSLEEYLGGSLSDERWFEEGDRRMAHREYKEALQAYSRAKESQERDERLLRVGALIDASEGKLSESAATSVFLRFEAYDDLLSLYRDYGRERKADFLRLLRKGQFDVVQAGKDFVGLREEMNEDELLFFTSRLLPKFHERLKQLKRKEK